MDEKKKKDWEGEAEKSEILIKTREKKKKRLGVSND